MCDHCNCRDFPPIAELSREHEAILALAAPLAAATRGATASDPSVAVRLVELLRLHSAKEEVGLYPLLIAEMGAPPDAFDHLEEEHVEILAAIEAGTFDHLALYALQRHIEEEEEVLFSGALFHFDGSTWDDLEAAHRAVDAGQPPRLVASGAPTRST